MGSCRICGDVTRWGSRLCDECVADLGAGDSVQSRSEQGIFIRRYGAIASESQLDAEPAPTVSAQLVTFLLLLGCVAVLAAGFWIAWQLSSLP
jgi:hypothetical protein